VGVTLTAHGDFVTPHVLGVFRNKVGDLGGDVAGGDAVGTGEADPLDGEGLACRNLARFVTRELKITYKGG